MKIFFKPLSNRTLLLSLFSIIVCISCNQAKNEWKISGTVENYAYKPIYISVRGQIDSTITDMQGNFEFTKTKQYSDFVRISTSISQTSVLQLFADSACEIQLYITDTAHMQQAVIYNSPESVLLQDLYAWHNTNKKAFDSTVHVFKQEREYTNNHDSLRIMYISKLDLLYSNHLAFLKTFIAENMHSPIATTASFMSFDTIRYKPVLLREKENIDIYKAILKNLTHTYGTIPFVELYARSVRAIEMSLEYDDAAY